MDFINEFRDPPGDYGPVPFWFLNEQLEEDRLQWQVREMRDKHVFGAVMHARPGLVTPYLSEEWFEMIGHILDESSRQGMFMWLYDEYPWMSGMAEYRVPALHPDYRIRALDRLEKTFVGPGRLEWHFAQDLPKGAGDIIAALHLPCAGDGLLAPARDVTSEVSDGVLALHLDDGPHYLAILFEHLSHNPYGDQFGTHPVSDLMNEQAMQAFLDLTHREYERRFPGHLGSTITASFTDEPPSDTPGWSTQFLEQFRLRKGYDPVPLLPALWQDLGAQTGKVRLDYYDVMGQLYEERFFGAIESWCDSTGTASTGHLLLEETLPFHARFMGDYFRSMRRLHYPGIDYIFPGAIPPVVCKMAASVANLYGRERVISECFALTGWDFTFERMKWMTDWQLVHGVNLLVPHGFFYSISEDVPIPEIPDDLGFRWYDCPPSMFFQQPYWDYYSVYADYLRRACYLLSQGEHVCDIALYYPIESVQAEFIPTKEYANLHAFEIPGAWMTADYLWEGASIEQTDAHFRAAANGLREGGLDFDVVDDDSLREGGVQDGHLAVQQSRRYRALILPRTQWIAVDVYRVIEAFWEEGGVVIASGCLPGRACEGPGHDRVVQAISARIFGDAPARVEALAASGRDSEIAPDPPAYWLSRPDESLTRLLRSLGFGDFHSDCPDVHAQHRRIGGADVYFLVHHSSEPCPQVHVALRGAGQPLLLDPLTGAAHTVEFTERPGEDGVMLRLSFEPHQSCFVVLGPEADPAAAEAIPIPPVDRARPLFQIPGPWDVTLDGGSRDPMRVRDLPARPSLDELELTRRWDDLKPWEDLGLAQFSGGVTYETVFDFGSDPPDDVWLDLGEAGIAAEVHLNDVALGVALWRPYRFRVSGALKQGENRLRVRVVNTLANSIAATYGAAGAATSAAPHHIESYARFAPGRLRSGLIGPVTLLAL